MRFICAHRRTNSWNICREIDCPHLKTNAIGTFEVKIVYRSCQVTELWRHYRKTTYQFCDEIAKSRKLTRGNGPQETSWVKLRVLGTHQCVELSRWPFLGQPRSMTSDDLHLLIFYPESFLRYFMVLISDLEYILQHFDSFMPISWPLDGHSSP